MPLNHAGFLEGFRGDSAWVHSLEGHDGSAYWPGGASGVTLDPGVDLGYVSWELFKRCYGDILTADQMFACNAVRGIKGAEAAREVNDPTLQSIRITRKQASDIFPVVADEYWRAILRRFPQLHSSEVPGVVHSVFLSLAYNRGPNNRALDALRWALLQRDWKRMAELIDEMQNDHRLGGVTKRRDKEANYIMAFLEARKQRIRRREIAALDPRAPKPLDVSRRASSDDLQGIPSRKAIKAARVKHRKTIRKVKQGGIWGTVAAAAVAAAEIIQPGTVAFLGPIAPLVVAALQFGVGYFVKSDAKDFDTSAANAGRHALYHQTGDSMPKAEDKSDILEVIEEIFDDEGDKQVAIKKVNALLDVPGLSEEQEAALLEGAADTLLFIYKSVTK